MLLGPIFGGIAIQLLGITAIIPVFVLVRVLEGLSTASSAPATLGYISAQTAGSQRLRGRVMGFYEAATVVGLASGAAVGGRLYEQFGNAGFSLIALIYVLSLLLFLGVKRHGRLAPRSAPSIAACCSGCSIDASCASRRPGWPRTRARRLAQRGPVPGRRRARPGPVPDAAAQPRRDRHGHPRLRRRVHRRRHRLGLHHADHRSPGHAAVGRCRARASPASRCGRSTAWARSPARHR